MAPYFQQKFLRLIRILILAFLLRPALAAQSASPEAAERFILRACAEIARIEVRAKSRKSCQCEILTRQAEELFFQIRARNPQGASGLIGNYVLHIPSLEIHPDRDAPFPRIDSPALARLRKQFLPRPAVQR